MKKLLKQQEIIRPLTLAVLAAIVIMVIFLRIRGGVDFNQSNTSPQLTKESFGELVNAFYPSDAELNTLGFISLSSNKRLSDSVHIVSRDGFFVQGYVSKPEGEGPFPYIVIVPDATQEQFTAEQVSRTLGELYAVSLDSVVVVIEPRSTHRGVDDVTDVIAAIEWQKKVSQIQDTSQTVVGIGYGAFLAAKASETAKPDRIALLSPILDLTTSAGDSATQSAFALGSDCEGLSTQDVCLANLNTFTLPQLPTYVQITADESTARASDVALITSANLPQLTVDVLTQGSAARDAIANSTTSVLTESLQKFSAWVASMP